VTRLTYIIVVVILLLATANVQAQQPRISTGTYTTYVSDQAFGVDNYTFTSNADGSIQSQSDGNFGPSKFKTTTKAERNRPVNFTVTTESGGLQADFSGEIVKITITGQPVKEVKAQPAVLIENGVWHQFLFLFAQYDPARSGPQAFNAFVPSQGVPFTLNLERLDSPIFTVNGRQLTTEHFRARTSLGLMFEIWTDSSHVPLFIQVPAQQVKIVRKGSEALADLISPPAPKPVSSVNDPYLTEEVTFQNGDQKLAGTLTIPKKGSAPFPAVVIISGSGSQDRDGTSVANLYRLVAEHISANGVAVLRADDRGAGKSIPTRGGSYRDLINDTKAAFDFLLKRPEIDRNKIALAGHSEGAETALTIAAEDPRVAAIMLLAGTSRSIDRVVIEQTLYGIALQSPISPTDTARFPDIVLMLAKNFEEVKANPKAADPAHDNLAWFREHAQSDPIGLAQRVRVPVLIVNGERDGNVLPYHALELAQALARSGNKHVLLRIFPNLTHVFTPSQIDKTVTEAQAGQVSMEFLELVQSWAANVLVRGRDGAEVPDK
jgi:dipeptidyl aminopeptidase/acylaminoacyl peptidase